MLGFAPLASAPLGGATQRLLVDLQATSSGAIDLFGSAVAKANSKSIGASTFALGGSTLAASGISLTASGLLDFDGVSVARAQSKGVGAAGIQLSGNCAAALSVSANSLSFVNIQAQAGGDAETRAASAGELTVDPASIVGVDVNADADVSIPFVLSTGVGVLAFADAFGSIQGDGAGATGKNALSAISDGRVSIASAGAVQLAVLSAAAKEITLSGSSSGWCEAKVAGAIFAELGAEVSAATRVAVAANSGFIILPEALAGTLGSARASTTVVFAGVASGTSQSPLFGDAASDVSLAGHSGAIVDTSSAARLALGFGLLLAGGAQNAARSTGDVSIIGPADGATAASGELGRVLSLSGVASCAASSQVLASGGLPLETEASSSAAINAASSSAVAFSGASFGSLAAISAAEIEIALVGSGSLSAQAEALGASAFELDAVAAADVRSSASAGGSAPLAGHSGARSLVGIAAEAVYETGRSSSGATQIVIASSRAIDFAVHSLCEVDLSAGSSLSLTVALVASVSADAVASTSSGLALTGASTAAAGVSSSSRDGFDVSGGSSAEAQILSRAIGELATASAGDAEAFVVVSADRTVLLDGSVQVDALVDAVAAAGGLEFALLCAGKTRPAAKASDGISIAGAGSCRVAGKASVSGVVVVTRTGAGDVSITGQSARVVTFLGSASLRVATSGAANSTVGLPTDAKARASVDASIVQFVGGFEGQSSSAVNAEAVLADGFWQITGASLAFLAAPSVRRRAFPSEAQGGGLISGRRRPAA